MATAITDSWQIVIDMYENRCPMMEAGVMVFGLELWLEMLNYEAWPVDSRERQTSLKLRKTCRLKR